MLLECLWKRTGRYTKSVPLILLLAIGPVRAHGQAGSNDSNPTEVAVSDLLMAIKGTLVHVDASPAITALPPMSKATLTLKTTLVKQDGGKFVLLVIRIGKKTREELSQIVKLELVPPDRPQPRSRTALSPITEALAQAIIQSARATEDADLVPPELKLRKLTATVRFGVSSDSDAGLAFEILPLSFEAGQRAEREAIQEIVVEFEERR